jgi:hypothetical protein
MGDMKMRNLFGAGLVALMFFGVVLAQDTGAKKDANEAPGKEAGEAKKADEPEAKGIQFLHDLEDAKKQAVEGKKKLFVVFGTPT